MMTKKVRFKDSTTEPNNSTSCRFDVQSASCEASEDIPMQAANAPKTSEFAFFKRLKQDVGHTSCQNPQNRTGCPVRKFGSSSHTRERGNSKLEDLKSSKKSTADEIHSFLSEINRPLKHSATPSEEHDSGRFNSASPLKTPINITLDSFLPSTANAFIKPESQQIEGDVFSSKRQKLLQQIARTFFPEISEVPMECDLVTLLLSRLLPECSQETLSQILPLKQPEPKEKIYRNLDSNIRHTEIMDISRKVVNCHEDTFSHTIDFDAQFPRYMETLSSGKTVEANAVADDILSNRTIFWQKEGNEHGGFSTRNFMTLGNELYGYSNPNRTSPEILKDGPCMKFSYDTYGSVESSEPRDCSHSYEVLDGSYNSLTAVNSGSLYMIQDLNPDRRAELSQQCWSDFSSCVSFKRFQPSALDNLRDYTEPKHFEIPQDLSPLLLGWNSNESDIRESHTSHMELKLYRPPSSVGIQDHWDTMELDIYRPPLSTRDEDYWDPDKSDISECDSTRAIHMELEIYCPPISTSNQYHWDSPDLDVYRPPLTTRDHWDNLENGSLMHLSPDTYNDFGVQGHHQQDKDLVPISPSVPYLISYVPDSEELSPVDFSSNLVTITQANYSSLDSMNISGAEAFISKDSEYDCGFKYKSLTGFLGGQYDSYI